MDSAQDGKTNIALREGSRTAASPPQHPAGDEHVFLIGRPPMGEYLGFIVSQTADGEGADHRVLADEWRSANDHIRELEEQETGWADAPAISPLPSELEPLQAQVLLEPTFQRSFNIVPVTIGMIGLDRLVVFQKHINLSYVRSLQQGLGPDPDAEAIWRFCLPSDRLRPQSHFQRIAQNAYVFVSPSHDFRFLESALLRPDQIIGYAPSGPASAVVGLMIGYGSNYLNAIHAENRLVLNNGSHRAFALREIGVTHVPCVVQHVSRREELDVIAAGDLGQKPDLYLTAPRPPLLKDYFDTKLRKIVIVPRRRRQVKISFGVEQLDVPGT